MVTWRRGGGGAARNVANGRGSDSDYVAVRWGCGRDMEALWGSRRELC